MSCATAGVYVFDYNAWASAYPQLAPALVSQTQATNYFAQAELYLDNSPFSIVRDVTRRGMLFGLLIAHIATLFLPSAQGGNGGAVGRTASASRGSVSVLLDMGSTTSERAAWFMQTQYGAQFWTATMSLRQARYIPGRPQRPRIWP
jgi:hypothetical protein